MALPHVLMNFDHINDPTAADGGRSHGARAAPKRIKESEIPVLGFASDRD